LIGLLLAAAVATPPPPALGRPIQIEAPTHGTVVSIGAPIVVRSTVDGDVVALAGDVELGDGAHVVGDVVALGGRVVGPGTVEGRAVGFGAVAGSPLLGQGPTTLRSRLGLALARAGSWVLLATAVVLIAPRTVRRAAARVRELGWKALAVGAAVLVLWFVVMTFALLSNLRPLGRSLVAVGILGLLVVKVVGLTVVARVLGDRVSAALPTALRSEVTRVGLAALALVAVGMLPGVGGVVWFVANLVGLGAVAGVLIPRGGFPLARLTAVRR